MEAFLRQELRQRILVLDGAMGTMIQRYKLEEKDFRGQASAARARTRARPMHWWHPLRCGGSAAGR